MKPQTKFVLVVLVVITGVFSWFSLRSRFDIESRPKPEPDAPVYIAPITLRQYVSSKYGFSFSYPDTLELVEYNPEQIVVRRKGSVSATPIVDISLIAGSPEIQIQSYEEFVIDEVRIACSYKNQTVDLRCERIDDVVNIKPFVSDAGTRGQVLYLKGTETNLATGKSSTARRGPFYTFNSTASTPNRMSFVAIYNPIERTPAQADLPTIEVVAKSFQLGD